METKDNIGLLYNALKKQGFDDVGDEKVFRSKISDENNRKLLYDALQKNGYNDIGDYNTFNAKLNAGATPRDKESPVAQQVNDEYDGVANETNLPQSSLSPYVRGKGKETQIFGVPYTKYQQMSPEEQSKQYSAAIEKRKNDEKYFFSNYINGQMNELDSELNKEREPVPMPAGSAFIPSSAVGAVQRFGNSDTKETQDRYTSLRAAKNLLDDANKLVEEAKKGDKGFFSSLGRGFKDKFMDIDNWTMGLTDTAYSGLLRKAIAKEESGEELSSEESKLLDAAAVNMAAQAYFSSDMSRGYKAGSTTAQSIPFMLEFAANPVSSSGNALAKGLLKHGLKRFGRAATSNAAKVAGRMVGDAAAAAGMTATSSIGRVASGTNERMIGDVQAKVEDGEIKYAGRENGVGVGEALGKSAVSNLLENQSEMVFNAFAGGGKMAKEALSKFVPGLSKLSNSEIVQFISKIKNNPTIKNVANRTQFHGLLGEYAEEVYNNFANIPLGEMTVEQATDLDNNIDTFLGLAPTSVAFGLLGAGGLAKENYSTRKNLRRFTEGLNENDKQLFEELHKVINDGDNEITKSFIKRTLSDERLTPTQKKERVFAVQDIQKEKSQEDILQEQPEIVAEDIEANKTTIYRDFLRADRKAKQILPESIISRIPAITDVDNFATENKLNDVQKAAVSAYADAYGLFSTYQNDASKRRLNVANTAREQAINDVELIANQDTGSVVQVKHKFLDNPVYLVGGRLSFGEDGLMDRENSDETLYYLDENGEKKMASASDFDSVLSEDTKENIIGMRLQEADQQFIQEEESSLNTPVIPAPERGDRVTIGDDTYLIEEQDVDVPGNVIAIKLDAAGNIDVQNGNQLSLSPDEYYSAKEAELWGGDADFSMQNDILPEAEENTVFEIQQNSSDANMSENKVENEIFTQDEDSKMSELESSPAIPSDSKGNLLYYKVPVDVTIDALNREELEPDEIDSFVNANIEASNKLMSALESKLPKMGTSISKYKADKQTWSEKLSDAKAQVDYWNSVGEEIAATRVQPGDKTAEAILSIGEPVTGEELAAIMLGTGRLPILYDSYKKETGGRNAEARGMVGLFASKANGGMSIEEAGEQLMLADQENGTNFFDQTDPNAGRNAIIDVLSGARTRGDLFGLIKSNREIMSERERKAEYDAYSSWTEDNFGMTPEDYESYEEQMPSTISERFKEFDEEEFYNNIASELNGEEGKIAGATESSEILQGEGFVSSKRIGASEIEGGAVPVSVESGSKDGALFDEAPAGIEIKPIGVGPFGAIYNHFKNKAKEAIDFLLKLKSGEATAALHHPDVGDIDLVWGKEGTGKSNGYGLSKIAKYHPEVLNNLQELLDDMSVISRTKNRINMESDSHKAAVRLEWDGERKNWLLTAFEKEVPTPIDKTTDTGENQIDLQSDTALLQDVGSSSVDKDSELSANKQEIPQFTAPQLATGEDVLDYVGRISEAKNIFDAEQEVNTNPTEAQKEAGNYKKGHIKIGGFDITIENPKGSERSGVDDNGQPWSVTMNNSYGYIRGTEGVDGDHVDVFLSDQPSSGKVYVIDQVKEDGSFDEHKVMYGFASVDDAKEAYLANYSSGWKGLGKTTEVSKELFNEWVKSSKRKTKPFAEYKIAKENVIDIAEIHSEDVGQSDTGEYGVSNKFVSKNRYNELKNKLRGKLGQMNIGFDPELFSIGAEMAAYHIEAGARKFGDFAKKMIEDVGDSVRPYLKSFYEGARQFPGMEEYWKDMDEYYIVKDFDTESFNKVEEAIDESTLPAKENKANGRKSSEKKISSQKSESNMPAEMQDLFNQNLEDHDERRKSEERNPDANRSLGGTTREEAVRTEQRGNDTSVHGHNVPDADRSGRLPESTGSVVSPVKVQRNRNNYSFGENHIDVPAGDVAKLKANIDAIRTLREVENSGKPATEKQKSKLARYVGWGGLSSALDDNKFKAVDANWNTKYLPYYKQLKEVLSPEEFKSAVLSTTTSHYTPEPIIRNLWNIAQRVGFTGGMVSEPAMGVGHILGLMPKEIAGSSQISGFEIDSLSGRISKALYPDANAKVQGYETEFTPQSKDLVITNVPFGKDAPYDKFLDKSLRKKLGSAYNLHNYFIAKGLLELKENGLGVFVTSSATMDGADSRFREFVAGNGFDLVGAIRLPNDAFQKNAGTSVTADILVFHKRKQDEAGNGVKYISTTPVGEGSYEEKGEKRTKPIMINEYFAAHPEMMLGEMMTAFDAGSGGLYSGSSQTLKGRPGVELANELSEAIGKFPEKILGKVKENSVNVTKEHTTQKDGTLTVKDGNLYVAMSGVLEPVSVKETFKYNGKVQKTVDAVQSYNDLKSTLKELIAAEQSLDIDPEPIRNELNKQYDNFVKKYGTLNRNKALDNVFIEDFERYLPLSLEDVQKVPSSTGKSTVYKVTKGKGIFEKRVSFPVKEPSKADNLQDAVNISLSYKGTIDVHYISQLIAKSEEDIIDDMLRDGMVFREPLTGNLVDKDTYLSGNVKEKLEEVRIAAEREPAFEKNVQELTNVQPETIRFGDISYRLGTPWIPTEFIDKFAEDVLGLSETGLDFVTVLNEYITGKSISVTDYSKAGVYRTDRLGTIDLFEAALNQRKPRVFDEIRNGDQKIRVINEAETQAAAEKVMEISDKFIEYIDGQKAFHKELERIYNDRYNNFRLKEYNKPAFEHYPNSNTAITLRTHQMKAVQRILGESTLLAHQVGTGKTFTMITAAMEMRRLNIAKKPMIVVQNATLEDFVKDFYKLYPGANVLAPGKDERSADNRRRLFNLIATGDFDAIIIPQSFMQFIPDDEGRKKELIQKRIDEYERVIEGTENDFLRRRLEKEVIVLQDQLEEVEPKSQSVKDKAKAQNRIKAKMERQLDRRTDDVMTFERMGINALFIDEAHNFKKIGFASKMSNVKGIDTTASQRANSLLLKAKWVQEKNNKRNVILATGTPITNTMAEVWTMMNFVAPDILEAYSIQNFDEFATTFGTVEPSLEFTATGNFKIADRFKSYVNVPELVKAFRSHADVVLTEDVKEFKESSSIPKLRDDKMTNIVIDKNEDLEDVMQVLIGQLERFNNMSGKEKRKMSALPLVVFTKAKQAAIDLRLLNPSFADNPNSKTNQVVANVVKLYNESSADKGAQLIFCDSYQSPGEQPKMDLFNYNPDIPRFNLYEDIKQKLIAQGIPAKEIAIVNNYDGERRKGLFEKVRSGDVRILLGSTEKMGVGVNVQDRMYGLHHIDAPLRPMDFEQRNGRILRQGNNYAMWGKPVNVVTYGVQGTLDATAYDRLKIKQNFINQMMKGNVSGRIMEEQDDEDPSGMTFNQMAATLSGDKTAQLLFVAENKLKKLRNLKRSDVNSKSGMAETIEYVRRTILTLEDKRRIYEETNQIITKYFPEGVTSIEVGGKKFTEKFGPSIEPFVSDYDETYGLNRSVAPLKMKLNGNRGEVVVHFNEGRMVYELYADKYHIVEGRQFNGGKGLMSSIEHQLKAVSDNLANVKYTISNNEKKIVGLTEAMSTPWGRDEELKAVEEDVSALKKQLEEKAVANSLQNKYSNSDEGLKHRIWDGTEEAHTVDEFDVEDIIYKFKAQVRNHPDIFKISSLDDIEQLKEKGIPEYVINTIKKDLENENLTGVYYSKRKMMIVFPTHIKDEAEFEKSLWHESVHYILKTADIKDIGRLMQSCLEYVRQNHPNVYKKATNGYNIEESPEESVAYLVEDLLEKYGSEKLINSKFDGNSDLAQLITQLFNHLKDENGREYNQLRQSGITRTDEGTNGKRYGEGESGSRPSENAQGGGGGSTEDTIGSELSYRKSDEKESDGTQKAYEKSLMGNKFKALEAYQDSMLALKKLQGVIEEHSGEKLKSFENTYMAENHISSKSTREAEVYGKEFFKPMLMEVGNLINEGASHREILNYMIAKHGLERNEIFAMRDAELEASKKYDKQISDLQREYDKGHLQEDEFEEKANALKIEKADFIQAQYSDNRDNDYSGLSSLTGEEDYEAAAKEMVDSFEERFDTMPFWGKINAATKETLRKSYESGMMSKPTYEKVKNQFKYYIPLRGWNEQTAADVYEYLNSEVSPVNSVLKTAKGRTSIADDPLAVIGNMAESTILQANRNLMKQRFMNMAINHPSDLLSISEAWYIMDPSTGKWTISYPNIEETDSADDIAQKVADHESRMLDMQRNGDATKAREGLNIDYWINNNQAKEHIVSVKRNGKDYLIYVNGNPRAAQAVNGLTNPDAETNKVLEGISKLNRQLAANFTTRNPAFVVSNLARDLIFSTSAVFVKEEPLYAIRYTANISKAMKIAMRNISGKAKDELFEEFLSNGGETGYTALHNVDEYKRMIKKELGNIAGKTDYFKYIKACAHFFSMMNRWAEDVSRFNAFMTSRELGRTVSQSIHDAKEITVNFNKKGSGYKTSGALGLSAGAFRNFYLFFNAAVQSLANFGRLAQKNKTGFGIMVGGFTTAGFIVPVLNILAISLFGDDDDDYYNNLSEWERRNNLCIYAGNGAFVKIPLPIELRAFYGLGEMAYQETVGNGNNGKDIAYKAINQMTELLPINPLGNNGDLVTTLMPDVLKPFWQINENMEFTGKPIYRDNSFNKKMPEWTKAYRGTSKWLVNLSEWSNELAGGDKYKTAPGLMNWNPAKVEHLFESYFGGMATTINQTGKTLSAGIESVIMGEPSDDLILRNMPIINRFVSDAKDDRTSFGKINTRYFELYNQYEETKKNLNGYIKEASTGNFDYLKKLSELQNTKEYEVYRVFEQYQKQLDKIRKAEKKLVDDSKDTSLQNEIIKLKKELIKRVEEI